MKHSYDVGVSPRCWAKSGSWVWPFWQHRWRSRTGSSSTVDVDHDLVTEFGHDDSIDEDRDQLGISNFESVGHYGYQIGPIVESGIEEEDDDEDSIAMEDSAMEDGDKEDNTAGETIFGWKLVTFAPLHCVCVLLLQK